MAGRRGGEASWAFIFPPKNEADGLWCALVPPRVLGKTGEVTKRGDPEGQQRAVSSHGRGALWSSEGRCYPGNQSSQRPEGGDTPGSPPTLPQSATEARAPRAHPSVGRERSWPAPRRRTAAAPPSAALSLWGGGGAGGGSEHFLPLPGQVLSPLVPSRASAVHLQRHRLRGKGSARWSG